LKLDSNIINNPKLLCEKILNLQSNREYILEGLDHFKNNVLNEFNLFKKQVNIALLEQGKNGKTLYGLQEEISLLIKDLENTISERDNHIKELDNQIKERDNHIKDIYHSKSWKITSPLRYLSRKISSFKGGFK
jgi:hypothetical protein